MLFKYADDTNVLVPETTDVCLTDEFENSMKGALETAIIINLS
jgi:hypothetical protein